MIKFDYIIFFQMSWNHQLDNHVQTKPRKKQKMLKKFSFKL